MTGEPGGVRRYIEGAPKERRPVLRELREACREELGAFGESMEYGMPSYSRAGVVEIAFASQKRYISLYVLRTEVLEAHRGRLEHLSLGKGCIRYRDPEDVELGVVRSMLRQTAESTGPVC